MRVFCIGTGRCGTTTFYKSCQHITNFTSANESHRHGSLATGWLDYPDNHIEVDPHLVWSLGTLINLYPDALFVHLKRNRTDVVNSWLKRPSTSTKGAGALCSIMFQVDYFKAGLEVRKKLLGLLYNGIVNNVDEALKGKSYAEFNLHQLPVQLSALWAVIGAEGNLDAAIETCKKTHNQGKWRK